MDRLSELESWRRTLGMANSGSSMMSREEGMALIAELQDAERRLWMLKHELRRLLEEA